MNFFDSKKNELILSEEDFQDFEQAIPLLSEEEERRMSESEIPEHLPILPLKNTVLFPGVVIPITVGRDRSLALVKQAYETHRTIGIITQRKKRSGRSGARRPLRDWYRGSDYQAH